MTQLIALAPDLLADICGFLDGYCICCLYFTGSRRLIQLMEALGGVKSFFIDVRAQIRPTFPHIASRLRQLSSLVIHGHIEYGSLVHGVDLTTLPPTITNLELQFWNAYPHLFRNPFEVNHHFVEALDLKSLFPQLKTLVYPPNLTQPHDIISSLPPTIQSVVAYIPLDKPMPTFSPSVQRLVLVPPPIQLPKPPTFLFPPHLTYLESFGTILTPLVSLEKLLPNLITLKFRLSVDDGALETANFPPFLEVLELAFEGNFASYNVTSSVIALLPRGLRELIFGSEATAQLNVIPLLPPHLTNLTLGFVEPMPFNIPASSSSSSSTTSDLIASPEEYLLQLPVTLTCISKSLQERIGTNLGLLPPSLTEFIQAVREPVDLWALPTSLTKLTLTTPWVVHPSISATPSDGLCSYPPSLRDHDAGDRLGNVWRRFPNLRCIVLARGLEINTSSLQYLRDCSKLESMSITSPDLDIADSHLEFWRAFPPQLDILTLWLRNEVAYPLDCGVPGHSYRFSRLSLQNVDLTQTPGEVWNSLPSTLQALELISSPAPLSSPSSALSSPSTPAPSSSSSASRSAKKILYLTPLLKAIFARCFDLRKLLIITTYLSGTLQALEEISDEHLQGAINLRGLRLLHLSLNTLTKFTPRVFTLLPDSLEVLVMPAIESLQEDAKRPVLGNLLPLLHSLLFTTVARSYRNTTRMAEATPYWFGLERPRKYSRFCLPSLASSKFSLNDA